MPEISPLLLKNLHLLACPVCHGALALDAMTIACGGCGRRYPIVDGLPVLIASRALMPTESH